LANKAAIKAMLINRIGDLLLLFGVSILYSTFESLSYIVIFPLTIYYYNEFFYFLGFYINIYVIACMFLFFGAMGKSAQLGLHV
jgi:NADH-quinone oxidoreductase subunit L